MSADCLQLMADAQEPAPKALENDAIIQSKTVAKGSGVYGCFYHKGAQTLSVRLPGEMVPVKFDCNACTRQINHEQGASEVIVAEAGDYEIIFDLNLTAKAAVFAVLELQVNGTALPGGRYCYMLAVGTQAYRGFTIASLGANDAVRLVMTSGTACEAALACGGVSAALKIIKLGE